MVPFLPLYTSSMGPYMVFSCYLSVTLQGCKHTLVLSCKNIATTSQIRSIDKILIFSDGQKVDLLVATLR